MKAVTDIVYSEGALRTYYGYRLDGHWHRWFAFQTEKSKWAISHEIKEMRNGKRVLVTRSRERRFDNKKLANKWLKKFRERQESGINATGE